MHQFISSLNPLFSIFLIAALGYLIGGIQIKGIRIGTSGVLLVALVFGHFGCSIPALIRNFGLAMFVASVGFIAGPNFFRDFVRNVKSYILLGSIIILTGALICVGVIYLTGTPAPLAVGLLTGALTSTPGLAAAQDAAGSLSASASVGYAIAYPFGVVGVVLFVQLIPKLIKADMKKEAAALQGGGARSSAVSASQHGGSDIHQIFSFMLVTALGIALGSLTIPLGGGTHFSLGTTGGPLLMGILFGHLGHIGPVDFTVRKSTLETLRELGLMLFLIGAGVDGGAGFLDTLQQRGPLLLVYGSLMTLLPMCVGYLAAAKWLRLNLLNTLGSITGGMTSTPALGTLIAVAGTDDVAGAYAATYPIALVLVVLCSQFIVVLFG